MSSNQGYPYPPVFVVDAGGGGQHPPVLLPRGRQLQGGMIDPSLVPCWSFPPAQAKPKSRGRGWGLGGTSAGVASVLITMLLLVFAALGLGTYQILKLQTELAQLRQEMQTQTESPAALQRLVALQEVDMGKKNRQAAHLREIGGEQTSKTLRWEPRHGQAFTEGVLYQDGGLQINQTGLYFVYSRVKFDMKFNRCVARVTPTHTVFARRKHDSVTLMQERVDFCPEKGGQAWTSWSYLGSVLALERKDSVYVNVSDPGLVSYNHNYFGLFKIG